MDLNAMRPHPTLAIRLCRPSASPEGRIGSSPFLLPRCHTAGRRRDMHEGRTVFSQVVDFVPRHTFRRRVARYQGDYGVRRFNCWQQFLSMLFAQLSYRESLRDIEACLAAVPGRSYHMGFTGPVSRSTLADANERRDWRIYADFAQALIGEARRLYADEPLDIELGRTVYALDSSTIDLTLSLFPWAGFQPTKAAVKLHTLLDLRGSIPTFIWITDGKVHDVRVLELTYHEERNSSRLRISSAVIVAASRSRRRRCSPMPKRCCWVRTKPACSPPASIRSRWMRQKSPTL
jgi:hypothetical protein